MAEIREGYAEVPGGRVYYKVVGTGNGVPLLTIHGGPCAGHDYLEPLEALGSERPVVFYDQLGCGKSDQPDDTSLWHIERFVEEVGAVRHALQLDEVHLLGQSWGGCVAIDYLLNEPPGVRSAVLYSTSANIPQAVGAVKELRQGLPSDVVAMMERSESVGDYTSPEYQEATMAYMQRHFCRLDPWPDALMQSMANLEANSVPFEIIYGPNEFVANGNLKDWDRVNRLGEIDCHTLVLCGAHDLWGPTCLKTLRNGIAESEAHVFEQSSHSAHFEEPDRFFEVLIDFLARSELNS